jgi:hypothetical protein
LMAGGTRENENLVVSVGHAWASEREARRDEYIAVGLSHQRMVDQAPKRMASPNSKYRFARKANAVVDDAWRGFGWLSGEYPRCDHASGDGKTTLANASDAHTLAGLVKQIDDRRQEVMPSGNLENVFTHGGRDRRWVARGEARRRN